MDSSNNLLGDFNYQGVYPCPVCRCGHIETLPLMDALACNFCRHIFTASPEQQQLKMADSSQPLTWSWDGRRWTGAHKEGVEFGPMYWLLALAFVALPPTLVGLAAYIFPADSGSALDWVPFAWAFLAFLSHLAMVLWLVVEFYQFPVFLYFKAMGQRVLIR